MSDKIKEFMIIMRDISYKYNIDEVDRTIVERFVKNEIANPLEEKNKELQYVIDCLRGDAYGN